ncbi:MAG: nucleotidyltransferase family protein [Desulfurococcaceae archaeon]
MLALKYFNATTPDSLITGCIVKLVPGVKALILAGGVGSRFHPYTEIIPKPMFPIGKTEKPVLELIVRWLKRHGLKDFVFLVDYKWKYIYNYFEDGSRFGVRVAYSLDEQEGYKNTGGAILKAYRTGLASSRGLIWYGDILAPLNVKELLDYHADKRADLTLVIAKRYRVPVGVVELDNSYRVKTMSEKPELDISVTIGIAVVEEHVFKSEVEEELGRNFDFMGDFVPWLINKGYSVYAYIYTGTWYDVGSLERYKKLDIKNLSVLEESI